MRDDFDRPVISVRPLVGGVEKVEGVPTAAGQDHDGDILMMLRHRLRQRSMDDTLGAKRKARTGEDKYEPQRLSRKICWQYDINAKKIPLLRRHYI